MPSSLIKSEGKHKHFKEDRGLQVLFKERLPSFWPVALTAHKITRLITVPSGYTN